MPHPLRPCLLLLLLVLMPSPLLAQDTPAEAYALWVKASKGGDLEGLLTLSTREKVDDFNKEVTTDTQKEEMRRLMKVMAPVSYSIKKTQLSPEGDKATLWLDALAMDFFSLNDPKAKPEHGPIEVRLVKEDGKWKIDQQCSGKDGCGREPEWIALDWGQKVPLPDRGTFQAVTGQSPQFRNVPIKGKPLVAELIFYFPETGSTLSYFLHRSPDFAEFYLVAGGERITPTAYRESATSSASTDGEEIKPAILKPDTSYSTSKNFSGEARLSLLFDLPSSVKKADSLRLIFTYAGKKYEFEVK